MCKLAHYCLDLAELFETDRVVPVVIFLHKGGYRESLTLGGDRHQFLHFTYLHCPLFQLPWKRYRDSDNLAARLNLPNMRYEPEERVEVYAQAVRGLTELEPDPEKQLKYLDFIDIYTRLSDNELTRYREQYPEDVKKMTNFAERFIEQGVQQGVRRGEATMLLRQMELKFGTVPPEIRQRILDADAETLLGWSGRILTAQTPEEVLS